MSEVKTNSLTNLKTTNSTDLIINILILAIIRLSLKKERNNKHL